LKNEIESKIQSNSTVGANEVWKERVSTDGQTMEVSRRKENERMARKRKHHTNAMARILTKLNKHPTKQK